MNEFKPIKTEKINISIRIDSETLRNIDELATKIDISRNEFIVQCIDYALKNIEQHTKT